LHGRSDTVNDQIVRQKINQSAKITICKHSGRNRPPQEQLSELAMLRLDSHASQDTRPPGHKIHTLKRRNNKMLKHTLVHKTV